MWNKQIDKIQLNIHRALYVPAIVLRDLHVSSFLILATIL